MHLTRNEITTKIPVQRKGTKYVARARSYLNQSVPVLIAARDMLKLARTAKDVKEMIKEKLLKINGKIVSDYRESIKLFNIFEAGKAYKLIILPTGKFELEVIKGKADSRLCKIINKKLIEKSKIQLNMHDGTNIVVPVKDRIMVHDSVELDFSNKMKQHISLEKGKKLFVMAGKYTGLTGKADEVGNKVKVKFNDKIAELNKKEVIVI